ncbi:YjeJ family protein [Klebsiella quasipneumoniae]|uniref:YjeJ family protein n=1 Tax=Klebsiella quasipneumoniae TaxID=1463165 RepID=UPI00272FC2DD|nr:YjeJ family protein [Klebsiella quasipneumoniae]MDP1258450.1 YjeJ family protein [Klebsiella quasipneumoniae]
MILKGLNTAPIKQGDHLFLMAFKISGTENNGCLFYMQLTTLVDLLIILRSRITKVAQRLVKRGNKYEKKIKSDIDILNNNIPEIYYSEVSQPSSMQLVTSIAPKFKDEAISLIIAMQNEKIITIEINDTQVEFFILAIQKAIETINDKETLNILGSLLDFLLLYSVDLTNLDFLNYKEINHELWKHNLYSEYLAVLYCFETERGKVILSGAIIKANAQYDSQEVQHIIHKVAALTPMLKKIQEKYTLYKSFCQKITSDSGQILTKEACLTQLHSFCLKTQAQLN